MGDANKRCTQELQAWLRKEWKARTRRTKERAEERVKEKCRRDGTGGVKRCKRSDVQRDAGGLVSSLASTKRAALTDLLTPYCGAARQSPLADPPPTLSPTHTQLIYLSHTDRTDPLQATPSNRPIIADRSRKPGERKRACEREIAIDLIRYNATRSVVLSSLTPP